MSPAVQMELDFDEEVGIETHDASGLNRLQEMVSSPDVPAATISRLIALEIARVFRLMRGNGDRRRRVPQRQLNSWVMALRELQRSLIDGESCGKRDALNIAGAKFQFVLAWITGLFHQALMDAGLSQPETEEVMGAFESLLREHINGFETELLASRGFTVDWTILSPNSLMSTKYNLPGCCARRRFFTGPDEPEPRAPDFSAAIALSRMFQVSSYQVSKFKFPGTYKCRFGVVGGFCVGAAQLVGE